MQKRLLIAAAASLPLQGPGSRRRRQHGAVLVPRALVPRVLDLDGDAVAERDRAGPRRRVRAPRHVRRDEDRAVGPEHRLRDRADRLGERGPARRADPRRRRGAGDAIRERAQHAARAVSAALAAVPVSVGTAVELVGCEHGGGPAGAERRALESAGFERGEGRGCAGGGDALGGADCGGDRGGEQRGGARGASRRVRHPPAREGRGCRVSEGV